MLYAQVPSISKSHCPCEDTFSNGVDIASLKDVEESFYQIELSTSCTE